MFYFNIQFVLVEKVYKIPLSIEIYVVLRAYGIWKAILTDCINLYLHNSW